MKDETIEQEIQAKGKTAPRITPADIEAAIVSESYFTAADGVRGATPPGLRSYVPPPALKLLTFCVLELRNGFTVTGESACASPENFDEEIGRKIARTNAVAKIWPLEGYLLRERLHAAAQVERDAAAAGMAPHQLRVVNEKAELDERIAKLGAFFENPIFKTLAGAERTRLTRQLAGMHELSIVLGERIAAF